MIVESPAKAKTIEKYLGRNYKVLASVGHIRDLKKSSMSVDVENNYEPQYINIRGKGPLINDLKKEAKKADKVFLASDPFCIMNLRVTMSSEVKGLSPVSVVKASLNRAYSWMG